MLMNTIIKSSLVAVLLSGAALTSCVKKEFDSPPAQNIPVGQLLTLQDLRDTFASVGAPIRFESDFSIYANVTMDDRSGNIYRNAYVQDPTGAIVLRTLFSGGLYEGDSVRIALKGTTLSMYNGMLQLDSVDVDKNIIKQATGKHIQPQNVTLQDLLGGDFQAKLVRINAVEFEAGDLNTTFANAAAQQTQNKTLIDCFGNDVLVRTSGYSDFASAMVPNGNGSLVTVVSEFNGTLQLYIRSLEEISMNNERCTAGGGSDLCEPVDNINEDFSSAIDNVNLSLPCWQNVAEIGNRYWRGRSGADANGTHIQSTSFGSGAQNRNWLISPPVTANGSNSLSFDSQVSFHTHNALTVWISTNYDGTNLTTANWVQIPATMAGASSGNSWIQSGNIALFGFMPQGYTGSFFIGFRYDGNGASGETTSFRLDNIIIN